jgi:hypothetical protein
MEEDSETIIVTGWVEGIELRGIGTLYGQKTALR